MKIHTGPVETMGGINKDICGAKLLPTTILACAVNCIATFLSLSEDTALLSVSLWNDAIIHLQLPILLHYPLLIHAIQGITIAVKMLCYSSSVS